MHIIKVQDHYTEQEFLQFPNRLYETNAYWVPPAEREVRWVFHTEGNTFFEHGEACRWILQNYRGKTIGRIAAFVDRRYTNSKSYPNGSLGFFECIDHQQAALHLLEEGSLWLQNRGVTQLSAPTSPTSLFLKSGLLTQGFDNTPVYGSSYHPAYYQGFFQEFGFQPYFRQQTYRCSTEKLALPDKLQQKAKAILEDKDYRIVRFCREKLDQMAQDIALVYNRTWQQDPSYYELSDAQIRVELSELWPWLDERVFLLAYYQEQPVGFFFNLPEINQVRKQVRDGLFRKVREAYFRKGKHKNLLSVLLGVLPAFQKKGVGSALIQTLLNNLRQHETEYDMMETNRVSDTNTAVLRWLKMVGGESHHQYWVYRKQLPARAITPSVTENQQSVIE